MKAPTNPPTNEPTVAPTHDPTTAPTEAPTESPTFHPCDNDEHECDTQNGVCIPDGEEYTCDCSPGYICSEGCSEPYIAHTCQLTTAPTQSPTDMPSVAPTATPTTNAPTYAPTEDPIYSTCAGQAGCLKVTYTDCVDSQQEICVEWDTALCSKPSGSVFERACVAEESPFRDPATSLPYRVDYYKFFDLCDTNGDGMLSQTEFVTAFGSLLTEVQARGIPPTMFSPTLTAANIADEATKEATFIAMFTANTGTVDTQHINCADDPSIRIFVGNIPYSAGTLTPAHAEDEWIPLLEASGIPFSTSPDLIIEIIVEALGDGTEAGWLEGEKRCKTVSVGEDALFGIKGASACPAVADGDEMNAVSGASEIHGGELECVGPSTVCSASGGATATNAECEWAVPSTCTFRRSEQPAFIDVQPTGRALLQAEPTTQASDPRRTWSSRRRRRRYSPTESRRRTTESPTTLAPTTFAPTPQTPQCENDDETGAFVEIDFSIRRSATVGQHTNYNFDLGEGVSLQLSDKMQLNGGDVTTLPGGHPSYDIDKTVLTFTVRVPIASAAVYDPVMFTFDSNTIGSTFVTKTTGSCEDTGLSKIVGPDLCLAAVHATNPWQTSWGSIDENLYGSSNCNIGQDNGVDYGTCKGESNNIPTGCSIYGNNEPVSNTGGSTAPCSTSYQCVCLRVPTAAPTATPTMTPTKKPTKSPTRKAPTKKPTKAPTKTTHRRRRTNPTKSPTAKTRRRRRRANPTKSPTAYTRRRRRANPTKCKISSLIRGRRYLTQAQQNACIRAYLRQLYRRFPWMLWSCSIHQYNRRADELEVQYELDAEATGNLTTTDVEIVQGNFTAALATDLESEGIAEFSVDPYSSSFSETSDAGGDAADSAVNAAQDHYQLVAYIGGGIGLLLLIFIVAGLLVWRRRRLQAEAASSEVGVSGEGAMPTIERCGVFASEGSDAEAADTKKIEKPEQPLDKSIAAVTSSVVPTDTSDVAIERCGVFDPTAQHDDQSSSDPDDPVMVQAPSSSSDPDEPVMVPEPRDLVWSPRKSSLYVEIELTGEELCLADIPELSKETIERAVKHDGKKKAFQTLALCWNPDKFVQKFGSVLCESEHDEILERVKASYKLVQETTRVPVK
eukprot:TRINITY_DN1016_c0_g3_i20.p1 TRINITY_DN1016_c0_g3~~TRINITY_DN1016_c0_g3_i20.p1  ORF type:complete len:1126 (+),score=203.93 TRINITY_DN1016_c0_g3_i20:370-3747(+)